MMLSVWFFVCAQLLLLCAPVSCANNQVPRKSKVLILGAGMAGIKAAEVLQSHGMTDFIILEGSNRIGGRLLNAKLKSGHSVNAGAQTVNQGGNWIAGLEGRGNMSENPVWTLAKRCKLSTRISDWSDNVYFIEKTGIYLNESSPEVEKTWEGIEAADDIIIGKVERGEYAGKSSYTYTRAHARAHALILICPLLSNRRQCLI